jgi:hypothetical protein
VGMIPWCRRLRLLLLRRWCRWNRCESQRLGRGRLYVTAVRDNEGKSRRARHGYHRVVCVHDERTSVVPPEAGDQAAGRREDAGRRIDGRLLDGCHFLFDVSSTAGNVTSIMPQTFPNLVRGGNFFSTDPK